MNDALAWVHARPWLSGFLVWLAATLFGFLFKPRTPAEYDKLPPRVAAALQLLGAVFGDGRKILVALTKILTGESRPPPGATGVLIYPRSKYEPTDSEGTFSRTALAMMRVGLALVGVGVLAAVLGACGGQPGPTPGELRVATFAGELERCFQRHPDDPCAYIQCRRDVQAAHNQTPTGRCNPAPDGGAPDAGGAP